MSDHAEIAALAVRSAIAMDHYDTSVYRTHWTEDAVLRYRAVSGEVVEVVGRDKLIEFAEAIWKADKMQPYHVVTSVAVDIEGDKAKLHYYTLHLQRGPAGSIAGLGEYNNEARRGPDGKWRMSRLDEVQLSDSAINR